jgi:hypothetical protein
VHSHVHRCFARLDLLRAAVLTLSGIKVSCDPLGVQYFLEERVLEAFLCGEPLGRMGICHLPDQSFQWAAAINNGVRREQRSG